MRKRFLEYVMNSSSSSSQFGHNHLHLLHESEALSEEKKTKKASEEDADKSAINDDET